MSSKTDLLSGHMSSYRKSTVHGIYRPNDKSHYNPSGNNALFLTQCMTCLSAHQQIP